MNRLQILILVGIIFPIIILGSIALNRNYYTSRFTNYMIRFKKCGKNKSACKTSFPIFYINMDHNKDRRDYIEKQLDGITDNYKRIKGFNGFMIENTSHDTVNGIEFYNEFPDLTKSEIGCTLSHIIAIYTAYTGGYDKVWICEDDVSLITCGVIPSIEHVVDNAPSDWGILQLSITGEEAVAGMQNAPNYSFVKRTKKVNYWSCLSYIINRKGMEDILSNSLVRSKDKVVFRIQNKAGNRTCDTFGEADYYIYNLTTTYTITPCLFFSNNLDMESTIHADHTLGHIRSSLNIAKKYDKVLKLNGC